MMADDVVYADEIADLLADVQAWVELQELGGAQVLPTEALLPPSERLPSRPAAGQGASGQRRPPRSATPPPARPPVSRDTAPAPRALSAAPETAARASETKTPAPASGKPALGRWAEWLKPSAGDPRSPALRDGEQGLVLGVGPETARVVVVGEASSAEEDGTGEPFVGPAGQMLDNMLKHVLGLQRADVYIANILTGRPPGTHAPSPKEVTRCRAFLDAKIRTLRPDLILVLGEVALRTLFPTHQGIEHSRGQWQDLVIGERTVRAMPTFHPAHLLEQPADKRLTFQDLRLLRSALDALPPR